MTPPTYPCLQTLFSKSPFDGPNYLPLWGDVLYGWSLSTITHPKVLRRSCGQSQMDIRSNTKVLYFYQLTFTLKNIDILLLLRIRNSSSFSVFPWVSIYSRTRGCSYALLGIVFLQHKPIRSSECSDFLHSYCSFSVATRF